MLVIWAGVCDESSNFWQLNLYFKYDKSTTEIHSFRLKKGISLKN